MPVSKSINTPFFLLLLLFILSIQAQPSRTAFVTPTNVFTPSSPLSSFTCGASLTRWDYPSLSLLFPFVGGWNRIRSDSPDCGVCLLLSNNNFNNYNNSNNSSDSANNSTSNNYNHNNHTIFLTFVHDANPPPPNTSGDHFIIPNDAFKILFDNFVTWDYADFSNCKNNKGPAVSPQGRQSNKSKVRVEVVLGGILVALFGVS